MHEGNNMWKGFHVCIAERYDAHVLFYLIFFFVLFYCWSVLLNLYIVGSLINRFCWEMFTSWRLTHDLLCVTLIFIFKI